MASELIAHEAETWAIDSEPIRAREIIVKLFYTSKCFLNKFADISTIHFNCTGIVRKGTAFERHFAMTQAAFGRAGENLEFIMT